MQLCFFGAYGLMSIPAGIFVKKIGFKTGIMVGLAGAAARLPDVLPGGGGRALRPVPVRVLRAGDRHRRPAGRGQSVRRGPGQARDGVIPPDADAGVQLAGHLGVPDLHRSDLSCRRGAVGGGAGEHDARRPAGPGGAGRSSFPTWAWPLALALLSVVVWRSKLPKIDTASHDGRRCRRRTARSGSAWGYRHLVLGAVGIFVYVGAEVAIGSLLVNYFKEPYTLRPGRGQGVEADGPLLAVRDGRALHRQPGHTAHVQGREGAGGARGARVAAGRDVGADDRLDRRSARSSLSAC